MKALRFIRAVRVGAVTTLAAIAVLLLLPILTIALLLHALFTGKNPIKIDVERDE